MKLRKLMIVMACTMLTSGVAFSSRNAESFSGEVSDSMCGAKHMMAGNDADCTRACVRKGSNYALVVGDKVYALHTNDKAALDALNKLAGEKATVTGTADGETIEVSKVAAAK